MPSTLACCVTLASMDVMRYPLQRNGLPWRPMTTGLPSCKEQWRQTISELAKCPNVVAKLGGINMEINSFGWHERDRPPPSQELMEVTWPYYEHTMAQFGVDLCMFASNFPVDKVSCNYSVLWNAFKRFTAQYSSDEKAKLFQDTATRIYRL
jgi:L-fuconolactonase